VDTYEYQSICAKASGINANTTCFPTGCLRDAGLATGAL